MEKTEIITSQKKPKLAVMFDDSSSMRLPGFNKETRLDEAIRYYIENYKPFDKAGAYGIQEWIGFVGVSKIEGSYANVMGMPTDKVYEYLRNLV